MKIISNAWKDKIKNQLDSNNAIDETTSFNLAIQWLIMRLASRGVPFKLYNLGAGVKRITTITDTCPCCKRKLI